MGAEMGAVALATARTCAGTSWSAPLVLTRPCHSADVAKSQTLRLRAAPSFIKNAITIGLMPLCWQVINVENIHSFEQPAVTIQYCTPLLSSPPRLASCSGTKLLASDRCIGIGFAPIAVLLRMSRPHAPVFCYAARVARMPLPTAKMRVWGSYVVAS